MSRRTKEVERLRQDMARVISGQADPRLRVPRAEAKQIREEAARERAERRESSMRVLLSRQYAPWLAGLVVLGFGAVTWAIRWLADDVFMASIVALSAGLSLGWVAWMMWRRHLKWRATLIRASVSAAAWLLVVSISGPSWAAVLTWAVLLIVASSSWWKAHRIPHPKAPASVPVPTRTEQSIPVLWDEYLGASGAVLAGSRLTDRDDSRANCESYTVNLRPGKQTITGTIAQLELIAGGLLTPVKNLVLEPHEDHNPTHLKLTIVRVSPIDKTLEYAGARVVGDQRHLIEVGPYGDGDGWARWRMWQPGELPMTGSWLSGLIIAGTGIGKSRLMELLAAAYMASGQAVVWFNDPQGGASSPALQDWADWYTSSDGTDRMLGALERIALAREKENSVEGWQRFDPSPKRPGIVVFLDEGHVTIGRYANRLEALARKTQKVGIGFVVLTQGGSLESLGKDILRASLMANLIVMKTMSNQTKNLLPGLTVDPEMLPKIPGFGYTIGERTAPFRSEYVAKPEYWFERYGMAKLDPLSANAAGDVYQLRREAAVEEQEADRRYVDELRNGLVQPTLDNAVDDEPIQGGAFQVAQFPTVPAGRPQDKPARDRVLAAVANGVTRTDEIGKQVGLGKSQLHAVLKTLVEEQYLEQPTRGVYAVAGSASPPVR